MLNFATPIFVHFGAIPTVGNCGLSWESWEKLGLCWELWAELGEFGKVETVLGTVG